MKFYFVRHGESQANAEQRYQDRSVPLSAIGRKQAEFLARRFDNIPINAILASSCLRTIETAEILNRRIQAPMHFTYLLEELRNPREIEGRPYKDPEAYRIKKLIDDHRFEDDWHYSNEENLADFLARAQLFCALMMQRREENILIVTHGAMLKMILTVMIFGDDANARLYHSFNRSFDIHNTGLSWCEFRDGRWMVHTWNDYEHLGQPRQTMAFMERN